MDLKRRGDRVKTLWDTGALGLTTMVGTVVSAGEVTYTVEWESGNSNRFTQGNVNVIRIPEDDYQGLRVDALVEWPKTAQARAQARAEREQLLADLVARLQTE